MWSRNEAIVNAPPVELWPSVSDEFIDQKNQAKFRDRKKAIEFYFSGMPCEKIKEITGISAGEQVRYAKRCSGQVIMDTPIGYLLSFSVQRQRATDYPIRNVIVHSYKIAQCNP